MHHFVYHTVITKNETGRVLHYIGKHSTENLNDGYVGSGKIVKRILNKEKSNPGTYKIECTHSEFFKTTEDAFEFEILAISEARDKFGKSVINIVDGGKGGFGSGENHAFYGKTVSEKHKQRLRKVHTGKVLSDETKNKLRELNTGKTHSEETKSKMSKAHAGKKYTLGHVLTDEHKEKLRIASSKNVFPSRRNEAWNYEAELYQLWKSTDQRTYRKFYKLATSNRYPDVSYKHMVTVFQRKFNDEQRETAQNN